MAEVDTIKRRPGRPFKFTDPAKLRQKCEEYFGNCDPHKAKRQVRMEKADGSHYWAEEEYITPQRPYIISGLAVHLDTSRQTLLEYQDPDHYGDDIPTDVRDQLIDVIRWAKDRCEAYNEEYMFSGKPTRGVELIMRNGFGWVDRKEVDSKVTTVEDDLDALDKVDQGKSEMADEAQKALDGMEGSESGDENQGSEAAEQVVAPDPPVQDQE